MRLVPGTYHIVDKPFPVTISGTAEEGYCITYLGREYSVRKDGIIPYPDKKKTLLHIFRKGFQRSGMRIIIEPAAVEEEV